MTRHELIEALRNDARKALARGETAVHVDPSDLLDVLAVPPVDACHVPGCTATGEHTGHVVHLSERMEAP